MAEELTTGTESAEGQSDAGTPEGTTDTESGGTAEGQSGGTETQGTTGDGTQESSEETFFDPRSIEDKPELMAAYKSMQRSYGGKMEGVKAGQQKIDAYDAFYNDPLPQIQQMASQMGYQLTRGEAAQVAAEGQQQPSQQDDWEPKTWDEVLSKAEDRAYDRLRNEFGPVLQQVGQLRETNMERMLDDSCPDWRQHEDAMMGNLKAHPTLVNNPEMLYRMSVPSEMLESRATQAALKKLQTKVKGSTTGASTTKVAPGGMPDKPVTFDEAVKFAKNKLASEGITP